MSSLRGAATLHQHQTRRAIVWRMPDGIGAHAPRTAATESPYARIRLAVRGLGSHQQRSARRADVKF